MKRRQTLASISNLIARISTVGLLLMAVALVQPALAQQQETGGDSQDMALSLVVEQQRALTDLQRRTEELEKRIAGSVDSDERLVDIRLGLEEVAAELLKSGVAFRPRLAEINSRLEQLGTPPADGQPPESELVAKERAGLLDEKAQINALIGTAEDLSIRVRKLIDRIAALRSELFQRVFTDRYDLVDAFGTKTFDDARIEMARFGRTLWSWFRIVMQFKFNAALGATLLAMIAAAVLLVGGRRLFGWLIVPDRYVAAPSYLSRLSVTFWSTLLPTAAFAMFLTATAFFFNYYEVVRGDIGTYLQTFSIVLLIVFAVNRLASAALSPTLPSWRLVPVETTPAKWLVRLATAMAIVLGLNTFFSVVNDQMGSPLSITIARSFIAAIIIGLLLIMIGVVRPFRDAQGRWRRWPQWLRLLLFAIGSLTIVAALLGYIGLAMFVSIQVVVTGTLLLTAYIGFLSARAIGAEGGFADTVFGRWAVRRGMNETTLDQLGLVVSTAINLLIVAIFLPLTLFMWGFQLGDLRAWAYRLATGIQIGSITISLTGILTGIFVFVAGYFLTRWFQSWLDGSVMARGKVDLGVRNSIRTVVGYAGLALAAVIAVSAAGIDLSNLALIAGGLSLGIGFGLQNVVSNFVSGLILLAERPFKAGDWIVAGDVSGTVKKISVRATEIETFQRQTMILPNSQLINAAVGNWTHRNKLGRMDIKVNLAYGTEVRRAHQVMLEIAKSHPMVLKNPEPFVLFANFGAAALEFEIRVFLADILNSNVVQNDIRFAVLERFGQEHIEIPSTPRAVVEPLPTAPDENEEPQPVSTSAHGKKPS